MKITEKHLALSIIQARIKCLENISSGDCSFYCRRCDDCYLNDSQGDLEQQIDALKIASECIKQQIIKRRLK